MFISFHLFVESLARAQTPNLMFLRKDAPQAGHVTTMVLAYLDDAAIAACARTSHHALEFVARYYKVDEWSGDPTHGIEEGSKPLPNASFLTALVLVRFPDTDTHVRFSPRHVISAETVVLYHMQHTNKFPEFGRIKSYMDALRGTVRRTQRMIDRHEKEFVFKVGVDDIVEAWSENRDSQMMFIKVYGGFRLEVHSPGVTSLTTDNVLVYPRQMHNIEFLLRATFVQDLPPESNFSYAEMLNWSVARKIQSNVNIYMMRTSPLCNIESTVDFTSSVNLKRVGEILNPEQVELALIRSIKVVLCQLELCVSRKRVRGGSFHTFIRRVLDTRWKELVFGQTPVVEKLNAILLNRTYHIEDVIRATSENRLATLSLIRKIAHGRRDCVCTNYCSICKPNNTCRAHELRTLCDKHRLCETCCKVCTRA